MARYLKYIICRSRKCFPYPGSLVLGRKHKMLPQSSFNVGPPSTPLAQHWINVYWIENTRCCPKVDLMLFYSLRRWPNIKPASGQRIVFPWLGRHLSPQFGSESVSLALSPVYNTWGEEWYRKNKLTISACNNT